MLSSNDLDIILLAAGKGTRLKSMLPKVLHPILGRPLLGHVIETAQTLRPRRIIVVVGHERQTVTAYLETLKVTSPCEIVTAVQDPQHGTGHALQQVAAQISDISANVLLLSGDVPLLRPETLQALLATHQAQQAAVTVLGATMTNPTGYGRLVTEGERLHTIVEEKDADGAQKAIQTVNAGVYAYHWPRIAPLLDKLSNNNAQREWYATDLIGLSRDAGYGVGVSLLSDAAEMHGVNNRADLAACKAALQQRLNHHWMTEGVTIVDPASTWIAPQAQLAADVVIEPGTRILGASRVGAGSTIGPWATIETAIVGEQTTIQQSVVSDSTIGNNATIGPFAHIRNGCEIADRVRVGNFVEAKAVTIGADSNAAHLAYIGNATLGSEVNIGAGTIFANYDPIRKLKQHTTVAHGAKVGSNTVLVAPVTIGENASVAAGTVVTKDVPAGDLAIGRGRQTNIAGWVNRAKASQPV